MKTFFIFVQFFNSIHHKCSLFHLNIIVLCFSLVERANFCFIFCFAEIKIFVLLFFFNSSNHCQNRNCGFHLLLLIRYLFLSLRNGKFFNIRNFSSLIHWFSLSYRSFKKKGFINILNENYLFFDKYIDQSVKKKSTSSNIHIL